MGLRSRQLPRRTRIVHILGLGLGVSVAALAGMVQLQTVWAGTDTNLDAQINKIESDTIAQLEAVPARKPAPRLLAVAQPPAEITAVVTPVPNLAAAVVQPEPEPTPAGLWGLVAMPFRRQ